MSDDKSPAQVLTADSFSEAVLLRAARTRETILETLVAVCEENDIDETKVRKMITAPLLSRLTAECSDARLIKDVLKSKKLV
ncbi:hypothetical protein B7N40_24205 [Salmonella enterica subsp. enterica serovar Bovismorbificans]|jgi:hypothetical protein|uniref:Late promoter transcription accessory protein gp33 n=18 Tax=Aglimvirinae TaxID=2169530 RepID=I0J2S7_9CAUD|nr:putative late promoter transcription accessory protein gp33 [Dickeya phage vB-DsoM-LIMEstone1]YP_009102860.1 putative late promoter transcription accessory protein [Dickeya phage RC-2014]YP_009877110.1 putative late promoter transcription accessory protein gp33 [Enterobacter phage EspM4VN]AIM51446.1 putative late promoter transcription accessory protein [Dickeya phage phiD3]AIM51614.1 putative late promoter transcription accessory protein [Dickeya phage phiDP10.3]AIM51848.1 putative late pr